MTAPTPSTAGLIGTRVLSVLAAMFGMGAIAASTYALTQGLLPFGGPFWLVAIVVSPLSE